MTDKTENAVSEETKILISLMEEMKQEFRDFKRELKEQVKTC